MGILKIYSVYKAPPGAFLALMSNNKIAVLGLGYVGLPLLQAFSKFYDVIGFDISSKRIND